VAKRSEYRHGVAIDSKDLWVIDHGNWMTSRHQSCLDINTRKLVFRHDFPGIDGSGIMQDLAVDGERGFVTLPIAVKQTRDRRG